MIRFFAGHRTAANLLMLAILTIGVGSIAGLKRETFPEVPPDEIEVRVVYLGATPEDVEDAVPPRSGFPRGCRAPNRRPPPLSRMQPEGRRRP